VANAIADQKVSSTHKHAICFVIDRTTATPMEAFFEFIPKRQTNATREYLARYVLGTSTTPMLHENSRLLVPQILGRFRFGRTKRSLRVVQLIGVLCLLPPSLVVVIGKTRVNTQHDDDYCPQNDQ